MKKNKTIITVILAITAIISICYIFYKSGWLPELRWLGIALCFSPPLCILISGIIDAIKLDIENSKWQKEHGKKLRRLCLHCEYCKTRLYRPFYNSYELASFLPSYCRKLRRSLPSNSQQRCVAKYASQAMYDESGR